MQDLLDLRALRDIGLSHDIVQAALALGRPQMTTPRPASTPSTPPGQAEASSGRPDARPDGARLARVIEIQRDHLVVHDGQAEHQALTWPALRVALDIEREPLVVGDWIWWQPGAGGARGWALARLPARNRLSRRDPSGGRQGLVANIDTALLVMGLDGDFNLRRLDRFLVLARGARAQVVVVLTKADRCADADAAIDRVREHLGTDVPVLAVDARADPARDSLAPWLGRGSTLVMLGSSGAGKSTLTNTLVGTSSATGAVRSRDERGQHTTTVRTLHRSAQGACVIDTPGLRQLWLDTDEAALDDAFPEIARLAAHCRYRDCRHAQEPGCAVREGVPPARLVSFQKLLREARRESEDVFQRRRDLAEWKTRARANRARTKERERGEGGRAG